MKVVLFQEVASMQGEVSATATAPIAAGAGVGTADQKTPASNLDTATATESSLFAASVMETGTSSQAINAAPDNTRTRSHLTQMPGARLQCVQAQHVSTYTMSSSVRVHCDVAL
jgi:hypothetical protein